QTGHYQKISGVDKKRIGILVQKALQRTIKRTPEQGKRSTAHEPRRKSRQPTHEINAVKLPDRNALLEPVPLLDGLPPVCREIGAPGMQQFELPAILKKRAGHLRHLGAV